MSYASAFAFYRRAIALGISIALSAWTGLRLDNINYRPKWQLIRLGAHPIAI